jgi:hypothetical protein
MGVDLTMGSGWPWGGPWVGEADAAAQLLLETRALAGPTEITEGNGSGRVEAVVIRRDSDGPGRVVEPASGRGRRSWMVPAGDWEVTIARSRPTGESVKRAGPGGEGLLVDPFSRRAVRAFLSRFRPLFRIPWSRRPRAVFTDSYEVYRADYTPDLFGAFLRRRGYDLRPWLPLLDGPAGSTVSRRLLHDYRETMEELLGEASVVPWRKWARRRRMRVRLQAHGAPGALVDYYASADIPETEAFGRNGLLYPVAKMASSAAHLAGRSLCSSETFTWLDEHFKPSLHRMRAWVDDFFLAGINHVFFHGVPSTGAGDPFPGQLFYASTNVSEHAPWFAHLHCLSAYIARIQASLQWGNFDAEVLLYFPMHDVLDAPAGEFEKHYGSRLRLCTVSSAGEWFQKDAAGAWAASLALREAGVQFDIASDAFVQGLTVHSGRIAGRHSTYAVLVLAGCARADPRTLSAARRVARAGGQVWFLGGIPAPVPRDPDPAGAAPPSGEWESLLTRGSVRVLEAGADLGKELAGAGVRIERLDGFSFIRRRAAGGALYFLRWNGSESFAGKLQLACRGRQVVVGDPVTGETVFSAALPADAGVSVPVSVLPGRTLVVAVGDAIDPGGAMRSMPASGDPRGRPVGVTGPWRISWTQYDGTPRTLQIETLASWPELPELGLFSGMVTYETRFPLDDAGGRDARWHLDLGELHESAEVELNGRPLGMAWTRPFLVSIPPGLLAEENNLRVTVANLPANRIIEMDRNGTAWRKFFFVSIDYTPFDASGWEPLPSGLLGPVMLRPF